jgi:uncharacterized BrkB/YihY/UPF0761 family membrane protein
MDSRYPALRTISFIYKVIAVIVGVGSLIVFFALIFSLPDTPTKLERTSALIEAVGALIGGVITSVTLFASGELFSLLIDVEENSRATRHMLGQLGKFLSSRDWPPTRSSEIPPLDVPDQFR